jgi:DNA-binding MarR family transcriptional regulator
MAMSGLRSSCPTPAASLPTAASFSDRTSASCEAAATLSSVSETRRSDVPEGEHLCERIRRAEQALLAHHEAALRAHQLTLTQYTVLLALSRRAGMSGAQLAKACGVTQQTMASVLANLQAKDLIRREPSSAHARVLLASFSRKGAAMLERAGGEVSKLERAFAEVFTAKEQRALSDLLERATQELLRQAQRIRRERD